MYLLWQDLDLKKPQATKVAEATAAYTARFHSRPNVVLMSREELVAVDGMQTRAEGYIRKNNLWVGWEDAAGRASILGASDTPQ
jgi:hypothetical protein